ncbi:MAG: hypothetical protein ACRDS9_23945 [Pseudonocardiaceae bacterium]
MAVVEPREFVRSVVDGITWSAWLATRSQRRTVRSVLAEASSSRPHRTHPQHLAGERPIEVYILIFPADRHVLFYDVSTE